MPKDSPRAESQKARERQHEDKNNPTGPSSRRKVSDEGVPDTLRVIEGGMIDELPAWLNANIVSAVQKLKEASRGTSHGVDNVQILLNVIDERKLQLATSAKQGEEKLKRRTVMGDRARGPRQWYEFRKQVWGMYYQIADQVQSLGPDVHQDVVARLNSSCGIFREELGSQLNWIKDVQENMLHGMENLANAVDTRLIQNDQRSRAKEGIMGSSLPNS